jgi:Tol biopolymer transport system component
MYFVDSRTWKTRLLPGDGRRPQWIPDLDEVAYECSADEFGPRTCVYSLARASMRLLPSGISYAAWSPEGRYAAYVEYGGNVGTDTHIRLYDLRTGATYRLLRNDVALPVLDGEVVWVSR